MALFDLGTLRAKITADKTDFDNKLNSVQNDTKTMGSKISSALSTGASTAIKGLGVAMAGLATGAGVATAKLYDYAGAGSDLAEAQNVVNETFKTSKSDILAWSKSTADAFGISETASTKMVGSMGAMLQSSGLAEKSAGDMAKSLVGLSGDMASFYNLSGDEAWNKIRAGIAGETEGLKALGINMSVANLESYALAEGIKKPFAEMSQAEQTQLRYNYLMKATATAQGDFARTSDGFANQTRLLEMNMSSLKTTIGSQVLPIFGEGTKVFNNFLGTVNDALSDGFQESDIQFILDNFMKAFDDLLGMVNKYLPKIINGIVKVIPTAIQALIQVIPSVFPVLLDGVMQILNALVTMFLQNLPMIIDTGLKLLTSLFLGIAQALPTLIPQIVDCVLAITETLIDNIDMLVDAGIQILLGLVTGIIDALPRLIEKAPVIISKLVTAISNNLPKLIEAGIQIIIMLGKALIDNIPLLVSKIPEIVTSLVNGFKNMGSKVLEIGKNLVQGIWQGIVNAGDWLKDKLKGFVDGALNSIKDFFGIHSPSAKTAEFGKFLVEGLANGVNKNTGLALSSIDTLNQKAMSKLKGLSFDGAVNISAINKGVDAYRTQAVSASNSVQNISFTVNQQNTVDSKFDADNMGDNLNRYFKQKLITQGIKV